MPEIAIPHPTGLLLALLRVQGGGVQAHGARVFTDHGRPFPGILVPFLRELFDHAQVRLADDQEAVATTEAGAALLTELENSTEVDLVEAALLLLDPDVWQISSAPGQVTVYRSWTDRSVDTLFVFGPGVALASRRDPVGRVVWREGGSALTVTRAVVALPPPSAPDAPSTPLPDQAASLF